jgi:hypothetical protein
MDDVQALRRIADGISGPGLPAWCQELATWMGHLADDLAAADGNPEDCDAPEKVRSAVRVARAYRAEATS